MFCFLLLFFFFVRPYHVFIYLFIVSLKDPSCFYIFIYCFFVKHSFFLFVCFVFESSVCFFVRPDQVFYLHSFVLMFLNLIS